MRPLGRRSSPPTPRRWPPARAGGLVRPLRAWLVTTHSGGSGQRAGRQYDRSARCSLDGPAQMPSPGSPARSCGEAKVSPEMPRWSAGRCAGQRHWPVISGDPKIGPTARWAMGAAFRTSASRRVHALKSLHNLGFPRMFPRTIRDICGDHGRPLPAIFSVELPGCRYSPAIRRTLRPMLKWSRATFNGASRDGRPHGHGIKAGPGRFTSRHDGHLAIGCHHV